MKVLFVTRGYPQKSNKMSGLFEKDQALALKNVGHEIAYAVIDIRSVRWKRKIGFNHFFDENGLEVFEMNWPIGPVPRPLIEYFRQEALMHLYPYILRYFGKPEIIHAQFLNYAVISVKLAKSENIPLVVTEHSSFLNAEKLSSAVIKRARKAYSACDSIIAVSESLSQSIKKKIGFDSVVINNIAEISPSSIGYTKPNSEAFIFAAAGLLLERKGFDLLIDAFSNVVKVYPNTYLTIYGDGPQRRNLEDRVRKKSLVSNIRFHGSYDRSNIPELYKEVNAFVLASRMETFGVVYIEAMSVGLPVIATICGGPENFVNDKVGYLIEKENIQQLTDAMIKMIENRNRFNSDEIKAYAVENFSPRIVAEKITHVYEELYTR